VTPAEAANHLGLSNYEDLEEAVEMNLFQCQQELIQKADQVLLFPAKEKRLQLFQRASETLGYTFNSDILSIGISESQTNLIEEHFHCFQANRSRLLKELTQAQSFHGLIHVQEQLKRNYHLWALYWRNIQSINLQEVKLSEIVDSMRFLQVINRWKEQGLVEIQQLDFREIPLDIQVEISRLQQVSIRLS
jgi:hypothetical protein